MVKERLKATMGFKCLTAGTLARQSGLSHRSINMYLTGQREPSKKSLKKLCGALGCTAEWLDGKGYEGSPDLTEEEYRQYPAVNKSTLWEIRKSPMHYKYALENPTEDTPALKAGRAIHMAVLQPGEMGAHYAVAPLVDRRTKEGKETWAAFCAANQGKEILTQEEFDEYQEIALAVQRQAGKMFELADTERPFIWTDERTGLKCKCRVDAIRDVNGKVRVIDLKTCADAGTDAFKKDAVKYGYHVQAAHYCNGVRAVTGKIPEFWFVAVEKKPPYAVNILKADTWTMDCGQTKLGDLMDKLVECRTNNSWPGYGENELVLPEWAMEDEDE